MYTLFFSPGACSLASAIALAESGLSYELKRLKFAENEQRSPEYLKLNPKGRVPALVTPDGVLTENVAILAFVAQVAPAAGLAPLDDPFAFGRMQAFNAFISSTVHVAFAHKRRGYRWADSQEARDDMAAKVPQNMRDCFTLIENDYLAGPRVMGEQYSVADAYLFVMSDWLAGQGVDVAEFPRVADHYRRMKERPAVQRALAEHDLV
jgi:glutathione S-transferase